MVLLTEEQTVSIFETLEPLLIPAYRANNVEQIKKAIITHIDSMITEWESGRLIIGVSKRDLWPLDLKPFRYTLSLIST